MLCNVCMYVRTYVCIHMIEMIKVMFFLYIYVYIDIMIYKYKYMYIYIIIYIYMITYGQTRASMDI